MRNYLILLSVLALVACASPAENMTEQQISYLTDEKLCELSSDYNFEAKVETEIGKRNIECTPEFLACKRQGYQPGTPQFESCKDYQGMKSAATDIIGRAIQSVR